MILVGLAVHNTILGTRNEKIVVACEDFLEDGDRLYEFDKIKVTFEPHFFDSNGNETNGVGVDLYEIMMTIIGKCINQIRNMIEDIPVISDVQKQFFILMIKYRYEKVLLPTYQKLLSKEMVKAKSEKGRCR